MARGVSRGNLRWKGGSIAQSKVSLAWRAWRDPPSRPVATTLVLLGWHWLCHGFAGHLGWVAKAAVASRSADPRRGAEHRICVSTVLAKRLPKSHSTGGGLYGY